MKDVLGAVAPARSLNLWLGTQCPAKEEKKKNKQKINNNKKVEIGQKEKKQSLPSPLLS